MRKSPISPVFVGAALLAVACSRPGNTTKDQEAYRDIRLIEEPSRDKQTVSDLEAGRSPPRVALPEARSTSTSPAALPVQAPALNHAAMVAELELEATMRVVTQTESPAPMGETSLPALRGPAPGGVADSAPGNTGSYGGGGSRGPMILIRGGMGGARDDCKIHGLGGLGGGGIAVNRLGPPIRGTSGTNRQFSGAGGVVRIR